MALALSPRAERGRNRAEVESRIEGLQKLGAPVGNMLSDSAVLAPGTASRAEVLDKAPPDAADGSTPGRALVRRALLDLDRNGRVDGRVDDMRPQPASLLATCINHKVPSPMPPSIGRLAGLGRLLVPSRHCVCHAMQPQPGSLTGKARS
jgi:hypothetical protein